MAISYQYNASGFYVSEGEDNGFPSNNSTHDAPPKKSWGQKWPQYANGKWTLIADHRERKTPYFLEEFSQEATEFWLQPPFGEDDFQSQPRTMKDAGPLPEGHSLTRPEKPLAVAQGEKMREIAAAHERALSGAVALNDPTPSTVAIEAGLLAASDSEGLEWVRDKLAARRAELEAIVHTATTVAAVEAVTVSFAV